MKGTSNFLMTAFACFLVLAGALYVAGEFAHYDLAVWEEASKGTKFMASALLIMLTITILPLSLRLFKFKYIHLDLINRKEKALKRWGLLRICSLGVLLVVNTFLYYAFGFEVTYGYLAVIVLLCMPFIVPTLNRCMAETSNENSHEEANSSNSQL